MPETDGETTLTPRPRLKAMTFDSIREEAPLISTPPAPFGMGRRLLASVPMKFPEAADDPLTTLMPDCEFPLMMFRSACRGMFRKPRYSLPIEVKAFCTRMPDPPLGTARRPVGSTPM